MDKERTIYRVNLDSNELTPLYPRSSSSLQVKEKRIENWMVEQPGLLFSNPEAVKIIAQEVSGEAIADLLAIDSQGNLIIIEIKRDSSDRGTIGQILDYAARLALWDYDDFDRRWQKHPKSDKRDLFESFKEFADNPDFDKRDFLQERRLFILATSEDEDMKRIIDWLHKKYQVPIDFVPFQFYEDNGKLLLEISKINIEPLPQKEEWSGDWFFNTNETYSQGAYTKMFKESVIAVYGYKTGSEILNRPKVGERVFTYVNRYGIAAVGTVVKGESFSCNTVFDREGEREFHRSVSWESIVDLENAIPTAKTSQWGYNLPVKATLCRIYNSTVAERIAEELKKRANKEDT